MRSPGFASRQTFHGVLFESRPRADNPAHSEITGPAFDPVQVFTDFEQWLLSVTSGRCIFVSDNPAYDFQWINYGFHHAIGHNPFGHSARRISGFNAGLVDDFGNSKAKSACVGSRQGEYNWSRHPDEKKVYLMRSCTLQY